MTCHKNVSKPTSVKTGEMTVVRLADLLSWSWPCTDEETNDDDKTDENNVNIQFSAAAKTILFLTGCFIIFFLWSVSFKEK